MVSCTGVSANNFLMRFELVKATCILVFYFAHIKVHAVCMENNGNCNKYLQKALSEDILPSSSLFCSTNVNDDISRGASATFNFTFKSSQVTSHWDQFKHDLEGDAFLLEMKHIASDNNINQTWTLRLGKGGNIYSFIGPFGQAVPPQSSDSYPWTDDVWQSAALNVALNKENNYKITQAGSIKSDDGFMEEPFYSPTVNVHCEETSCTVTSWGQHATIPTTHTSNALYINRYTDCGNGVIEHTSAVHNMGSREEGDVVLNYLHVPLAGIRTSTLQDVYLSTLRNGKHSLTIEESIQFFDNMKSKLRLSDTGGYTTFAQSVNENESNAAYGLPCGDGDENEVPCEEVDNTSSQIKLIVLRNSTCVESAAHTESKGRYTVKCRIVETTSIKTGCDQCNMVFSKSKSGESIVVSGILHWSWAGTWLYFYPQGDILAEDVNNLFKAGDEINVLNEIQYGDSLALTFVHGSDDESLDPANSHWLRASSTLQYGLSVDSNRDMTHFVVDVLATVRPGDTYAKRQYMITDRLSAVDEHASLWVGETTQSLHHLGNHSAGRAVHLYSAEGVVFGSTVGSDSCGDASALARCEGSTVPQLGKLKLFSVQCGNASYVGSNLYHFSPPRTDSNGFIRSYVCDGEDLSVRPSWILLGYFREGSCEFLRHASYNIYGCAFGKNVSMEGSEVPSFTPSQIFSRLPSRSPLRILSQLPSHLPSLSPTQFPSQSLSQLPSPSQLNFSSRSPSQSSSQNPSHLLTMYPSQLPRVLTNHTFLPSGVPSYFDSTSSFSPSNNVSLQDISGACVSGFTGVYCKDCCNVNNVNIAGEDQNKHLNANCLSNNDPGKVVLTYRQGDSCSKCSHKTWAMVALFSSLLSFSYFFSKYTNVVDGAFISIGIEYFQYLSFLGTIDFKWSQIQLEVLTRISIFNFDLTSFSLECIFPMRYSTLWIHTVIMPIYVCVIFTIYRLITYLGERFTSFSGPADYSKSQGALGFLISIFFAMYLQVTMKGLEVFDCSRNVSKDFFEGLGDDRHKLHMAPIDWKCYELGSDQDRLMPYAGTVLLLFTIGFPAMVVSVLFSPKHSKKMKGDQTLRSLDVGFTRETNPEYFDFRRRYSSFYQFYKADIWFWSFVVCIRKIIVAAIPFILRYEPPIYQIGAIGVVFIGSSISTAIARPYFSLREKHVVMGNSQEEVRKYSERVAKVPQLQSNGISQEKLSWDVNKFESILFDKNDVESFLFLSLTLQVICGAVIHHSDPTSFAQKAAHTFTLILFVGTALVLILVIMPRFSDKILFCLKKVALGRKKKEIRKHEEIDGFEEELINKLMFKDVTPEKVISDLDNLAENALELPKELR